MAMSVIGALRANLGLDSAKFSKGAQKAKEPMARLKSDLKKITAVASAAGAAIVGFAFSGAREIDEAAKASRRLGSSIAGFRGLQLAASEAGVNLSSLTNDIQTLDREIASIGTTGNGARALKALGLTVEELAGVDADEKIARIADKVTELGLSSGETTAILRDLGVRNREMVLLMLQGGDAIRRARGDIEDYGLALSEVDATRIEVANDAIARLGLVGRYVGQRLALEIVPALGDFAARLTDSLRAGGALRVVLDFLIDNLARFATYVATAVSIVGIRYVAALAAARLAAMSLSGALAFLRGALIRTGIGALVVAAGEMVFWFGRLVKETGGWGGALSALGDLAKGVWKGIKTSASSIGPALKGVWVGIKADFVQMLADMRQRWFIFVNTFRQGLIRAGMDGMAEGLYDYVESQGLALDEMQAAANDLHTEAAELAEEAKKRVVSGFEEATAAAKALRDIVSGTSDAVDDGSVAVDRLSTALDNVPAAASAAASGVSKATEEVEELNEGVEGIRTTAQSAFADMVTGAKTAREAVSAVLDAIARRLAELAFNDLFSGLFGGSKSGGGGFGSFLSGLLGFANGTNSAPGGLAKVGERGPELVNLPRGSRVHTAQQTRQMLQGASDGALDVRVFVDQDGNWAAEVDRRAAVVASKATEAGIGEYHKQMPRIMKQIQSDPHHRRA